MARRTVMGLTPNSLRNCGLGRQLIAGPVDARPDLFGDGVGDVEIGGLEDTGAGGRAVRTGRRSAGRGPARYSTLPLSL